MSRMETFNYIEEKLNFLAFRIKARTQMNLLDLNIHTESFISNLLNIVYEWNLININIKKRNMEAIDLVDDVNKIIVQVSSVINKRKIENALSSEIMLQFKNYSFKYVCLAMDAEKLCLKAYNNLHNSNFPHKKWVRTLKNQYFRSQNNNHMAYSLYDKAVCIYFGSL